MSDAQFIIKFLQTDTASLTKNVGVISVIFCNSCCFWSILWNFLTRWKENWQLLLHEFRTLDAFDRPTSLRVKFMYWDRLFNVTLPHRWNNLLRPLRKSELSLLKFRRLQKT